MIVSLEHVSHSYDGKNLVLEDITAKIEDRDKIGLIGVNGAGKSTLLGIICGELECDGGTVTRSRARIGYLRQNSGLSVKNSIIAEMRGVFSELLETERELGELEKKISHSSPGSTEYESLTARYARLRERFESRDGYMIDVKIRTVLGGMGFGDTDPDTPVEVLSGGERTRLALCKLLLEQPELLILDEPTNHLDFKTLGWLEDFLLGYKGAVLAVSHDRYFLDKLCGGIWEIERRRLSATPGNYSKYAALKRERLARQWKEYEQQQARISELKDFIARNLARASTTARAQSRRRELERMQLTERPRPPAPPPKLRFSCKREPVRDVLSVTGLALSVGESGERRRLFGDVELKLMRGDKVALVGSNGVGKTSFLRALMAKIHPDEGRVDWGMNTDIGYFEQGEEGMYTRKTALSELWDRFPHKSELELRTLLGGMGITGENVFKYVGSLSGGERARVKFAALILREGNVLLMDEPTNHLDLDAKEALDEALCEYAGTLLVVSHDRYLLNKFPDRIAEMHSGGMRLYNGKYDSYLRQKDLESSQSVPERPAVRKGSEKTAAQGGYRGKKERSAAVARNLEISGLERDIAALEADIAALEERIQAPEVASDYQLLGELCAELEEKRGEYDRQFERWYEVARQRDGGEPVASRHTRHAGK